jgi:hypothetical protein
MHVLSMLISFDMGVSFVGHILDNHIIMGWTSKSQIIEVQNPTKSPFPNPNLVWKKGEWHGSTNKISIECSPIPHGCVHEFLEGEWGDLHSLIERNIFKNVPTQNIIKNTTIKHHLGHTW